MMKFIALLVAVLAIFAMGSDARKMNRAMARRLMANGTSIGSWKSGYPAGTGVTSQAYKDSLQASLEKTGQWKPGTAITAGPGGYNVFSG